jgi:hypothetical protein
MNVFVVTGNTFSRKGQLGFNGMKFNWLPGDKVWVKWLGKDESKNEEIQTEIKGWDGVEIHVVPQDAFLGTCVDMNGDKNVTTAKSDWRKDLPKKEHKALESHDWDGRRAELNKWGARSVQEKANEMGKEIGHLYRNIIIRKVESETKKAVLATIEFFGGIANNCHVCGQELTTEISRACGIGPVCASRMGMPRPTLTNAKETLRRIEEIVAGYGEIGPVWIPKACLTVTTVATPRPKVL